MTTTGFLHPGAMGATIAAACGGTRLWASEGRSERTRARAEAAGLTDAGSLAALIDAADTIVSICPPDQALAVARSIATLGFEGLYVDANAVSPATTVEIGSLLARYIDGAIIGPPARRAGTTRMYLSGDDADTVAERWRDSIIEVRTIQGGIGAASAVKMCFAAWTKHNHALLLAINAVAEAYGVIDTIRSEWAVSIPDLPARADAAAEHTSPKAWRFEGEMHEIADTFAAAGLPAEFHLAAAEIYRRMARFRTVQPAPELPAVIEALRSP